MSKTDDLQAAGIAPSYRGKVRDIYDLGERLLLVASDRISAFDVVLPRPIPEKGAILTAITSFWLDRLEGTVAHHRISTDAADLPPAFREAARQWGPRFMLVDKLVMFPVECVVRGYLVGSGWKEYQQHGTVCGLPLPAGLAEAAQLPEPIFTPSTKAQEGHDENISFEAACALVGAETMHELRRLSFAVYQHGCEHAREHGIILADTKFEFGHRGDGKPVLGDEVLTPDSSRFWPAAEYRTGGSPPSFDKQFVRDYLSTLSWNKKPPAPELPDAVIAGSHERYCEIYRRLTGRTWKGTSR